MPDVDWFLYVTRELIHRCNCVIVSQYLHIGSIYTDPHLHNACDMHFIVLWEIFKALTR